MMNFNLVVRLLLVLSISSLFYSFTYIKEQPYVVILGIAQDGGAPHAACQKTCCINKWNNPNLHNKVSSIGIVDPVSNEVWMIDATPDFAEQLHLLTNNNKRELMLSFQGGFLQFSYYFVWLLLRVWQPLFQSLVVEYLHEAQTQT